MLSRTLEQYMIKLRTYVELSKTLDRIEDNGVKKELQDYMNEYCNSVIYEYSANNMMSWEDIIGCQMITRFCDYRQNDFKEILNNYVEDLNR